MRYIGIENNIVSVEIEDNEDSLTPYTPVPADAEIIIRDDVRYFDLVTYKRKSIQRCIAEGLIVEATEPNQITVWLDGKYQTVLDYRSFEYWYKETKEKVGFQYNDIPDETMTDIIPIDNEYTVWNGTGWEIDITPYKLSKQSEVTALRDQRILAGFVYKDKQISCDLVSQANANAFLTSDLAGVLVYPVEWRTADNSIIKIIDTAELRLFTGTMMGFVQSVFQNSWNTKDAINNASAIEEIDIIFGEYNE